LPSQLFIASIEFSFTDIAFNVSIESLILDYFLLSLKTYSHLTLKGFVGIDDIIVHEGQCIATDLCTFENSNLCGYTNDASADFYWSLGMANSSNDETGPQFDV
jgi:hypothetical protein